MLRLSYPREDAIQYTIDDILDIIHFDFSWLTQRNLNRDMNINLFITRICDAMPFLDEDVQIAEEHIINTIRDLIQNNERNIDRFKGIFIVSDNIGKLLIRNSGYLSNAERGIGHIDEDTGMINGLPPRYIKITIDDSDSPRSLYNYVIPIFIIGTAMGGYIAYNRL